MVKDLLEVGTQNQQINKMGAIATKCGLDQEERCF
jgi:hypothetical protein